MSTTARRVLVWPLLLGLLVLVAWEVRALADDGRLPTVAPEVTAVAHDFAVAATSFDFRRIDRDVERVLAFGSDAFADEFVAAMGPGFATEVVEGRRVSVGEVVAGPTVQRRLDDRAVLLVVVAQQVTSLDGSDRPGTPEHVRVALVVTVTREAAPRVTSVQVL